MGADNHPTVDVSNEPDMMYAVVDRRDSYHPHTVGHFNTESAAEDVRQQLLEKRQGPSTIPEDRWFVVREIPLYNSVEEYDNYDPRDNE